MAPAMMMLLAARELRFVLRGFLVLPSYMLLCGAARLPGTSLAEQRAHLREAHRLYNFVMDSVQAALLEGVFLLSGDWSERLGFHLSRCSNDDTANAYLSPFCAHACGLSAAGLDPASSGVQWICDGRLALLQ